MKVSWIRLITYSIVALVVALFIMNYFKPHPNDKLQSFTSENGTKGEYLIYPAKHAKGILVWLHGDGAYEFLHPKSYEYLGGDVGIKQIAKEKNLTLIVPKSPRQDETWWKKGKENSQYLVELISSIPQHENLWIGSFSGGSEMSTYWLLDKLPEMNVKSGGAIFFGGGGPPKSKDISREINKENIVEGSFPLTWVVGEHDFGVQTKDDPFNAFESSKEGENFYKKHGWKTDRHVLSEHQHHLSKEGKGLYGEYLNKYIQE